VYCLIFYIWELQLKKRRALSIRIEEGGTVKNNYWVILFISSFFCIVSSNLVLASGKGETMMPDFSLPSVSDETIITNGDFKGKVLLVNFFATWCPPCLKEIPTLVGLQKNYAGQNFTVLGFSVDKKENMAALKKLMTKTEVNYPVALADPKTKKEFGATFLPMTFLIDKKGMIVKSYFGERKSSVFEKDINELLQ
jgi:cytochrome c biogenesis protein CcmG/thiol:disulfide interchange protein DsbE